MQTLCSLMTLNFFEAQTIHSSVVETNELVPYVSYSVTECKELCVTVAKIALRYVLARRTKKKGHR